MSEMTNFTQPDIAPSYFIEFLEFLDNHAEIKNLRAEISKRQCVDSTVLPRLNPFVSLYSVNPSQGSVPAHLTLASDLVI